MPFVGALVDSCCGFHLNPHVEVDRIDRLSLHKEAEGISGVAEKL
jgi:hypothetical protein